MCLAEGPFPGAHESAMCRLLPVGALRIARVPERRYNASEPAALTVKGPCMPSDLEETIENAAADARNLLGQLGPLVWALHETHVSVVPRAILRSEHRRSPRTPLARSTYPSTQSLSPPRLRPRPKTNRSSPEPRDTGVEGLEPPTAGFGNRCSSQLSYTPWQAVRHKPVASANPDFRARCDTHRPACGSMAAATCA